MEERHNQDLLTSDEAQNYLVSFGVPVKSRYTFYKWVEKHQIDYFNLTPWSRKKTRRFKIEDLDKFLEEHGFKADHLRPQRAAVSEH